MLYAAVIVPIVRYDDPAIVFVRRAAHLRRNPGQIGFPGGLIDAADSGPAAAALREFEEELGVARDRVRIVECLGEVVTLALSVTVTPYVGLLEPPLHYAPDASETASVHEVPLHSLYAPGALHFGSETVVRDGLRYEVPTWLFDYDGLHVWGATARILHDLRSQFPSVTELVEHRLQWRAP